jgi:histidinol-phosphate aminotransferase
MSLIRKSVEAMSGYVPGEQPRDADIIKLNTNENPYPPSPRVMDALVDITAGELSRYPDPVCMELRREISELHGTGPEQVFVGNGSDEVLALCIRAFVERDGSVGYFDPSYSLYPVLAQIEDVAVRPVPLADDFAWAMPADYEASLFFLAYPNAPTSLAYPHEQVEEFCRAFKGVVLLDEAYVDFAEQSVADLALQCDNVLVSRTLSKSYSLAGIRLGYAVGPLPLIEALYKIKDSYNVNRLTQAVALAALQDRGWMEHNAERIRSTRKRVSEALAQKGFTVMPSQTNFLWIRPGNGSAEALFAALRVHKIIVRYFPGERTGEWLRVSVGTDDQMDALLAAVDALGGH